MGFLSAAILYFYLIGNFISFVICTCLCIDYESPAKGLQKLDTFGVILATILFPGTLLGVLAGVICTLLGKFFDYLKDSGFSFNILK